MYEAFYGLTEKPFNLTPDPRFLYLSTKHKEAFAHLLFGIRNRCGFIMVSGEIGTGKTTICRSLLRQLDPDTEVAFIFNPKLSPLELLQTINSDFGIASKAGTVRGLIDELNAYLLARSSEGKNCVLIIDEAQNLGTETLEQVRLLSNLETETQKLLQIVLIGQPELAQKLQLRELRQLNQRIVARYHLGALNREETLHYIAFRMRVAGARTQVRFARSAVRMVYRISQGTPRVINALCDRALLIGYTKETRTITPRIVKTAAKEIQGDYHVRVTKVDIGRALPVSAAITTAAVLVLGFMTVSSGPFSTSFDGLNAKAFFGITTDVQDKASASDTPQSVSALAPTEREPAPNAIDDAVRKEDPARSNVANRNVVEAASLPDAPGERVAKTPGPTAVARANAGVLPSDPESASALRATGPHLGAVDLVRAWNLAVLTPPPATLSVGGLYRFAEANGLRLTELTSNLDQLATINLPVMMVLRHEGKNRWGALVRLNDDAAEVAYEDGTHIFLGRSALRRAYRGKAYCLWSDPAMDALPLRAMSTGPDVDHLQDDLEVLGLLDRAPTGLYDAATVDVITRIQRATGLEPDGIVGPQTRMVLTSWLSRHTAPSLNDQSFSEVTRAAVLANAGMIPSETAQAIGGPSPLPRVDAARGEVFTPEAADVPVEEEGILFDPVAADVGTVEIEPLFEEEYAPLLETADSESPQITPALGPAAPIVPRDERGAASR